MEPTIHSGDVVVLDKFSFKFINDLRQGDIVVATQPSNPAITIVKRIKAVGGQSISFEGGTLVPESTFWLEGDNKNKSVDSRHHGSVPYNLIIGKVILIIHL